MSVRAASRREAERSRSLKSKIPNWYNSQLIRLNIMRVSATAIFTLATLTAANVTQQATAAPAKTVTPTAKAGNLVMKEFY